MRKIVYISVFILATATASFAQKLTVQASRTKVAVGETFQISFSLNTNGNNFKAPALNEFDVYSGPNQSTSMSFINGAMSQSITLSYIVSAKKEGKFTIGAASMNIGGGTTVQSAPIVIEVVKGSSTAQTQGNGNAAAAQNAPASTTESVGDNLFVRTIVSKTKAYLGEQITVTHKVYTN
jgi:hypothetical protein